MNMEESGIIDGYGECTFASYQDALEYFTKDILPYRDYIWRGQRCEDWALEPTLHRLVRKTPSTKRQMPPENLLERFQFASRGRRGPNPPALQTDNDWWALGQHHGLATPLLDWTESPFVALYFAFIEVGGNQTDYRAVYGLYKPQVETKVKERFERRKTEYESRKDNWASSYASYHGASTDFKPSSIDSPEEQLENTDYGTNFLAYMMPPVLEVEFIRPLSDENPKLVSQAGLFTHVHGSDVKEWVQKNFRGEKGYILMKLRIPNKDREDCLRALNRMNINHLSLFPDLYGASKYCNLYNEIENY